MTHLTLLPSIDQRMTDACLETWKVPGPLIVVDNTEVNKGVPASWNIGARAVLEQGLDWLIVLSAGVRFGKVWYGGDLIHALDADKTALAIEADDGLGWHCIAFSNYLLTEVGLFDERFFPAYYEDNDFAYRTFCRFRLDEQGPWWPKVKVDVRLAEVAHGLKRAKVQVDMVGNLAKYEEKHGGPPGKEAFRSTHGACPECGQVYEVCRSEHP